MKGFLDVIGNFFAEREQICCEGFFFCMGQFRGFFFPDSSYVKVPPSPSGGDLWRYSVVFSVKPEMALFFSGRQFHVNLYIAIKEHLLMILCFAISENSISREPALEQTYSPTLERVEMNQFFHCSNTRSFAQ